MQARERLAKLIVKLTSDHGPFVLAYGLQSCCERTQLIAGILKFLFRLLQTDHHDVALTDNRVHLVGLQSVDERLVPFYTGI